MTLVAGVDSSTQSCKVMIRDAETGALVRHGRAAHPEGTEVDPQAWWQALLSAIEAAGGIADVAALSIGGQQHGMVCLDADGQVVRPALLWNDTRSAGASQDLITEFGPQFWADTVGSVPLAAFTVTKLRWLAEHEPTQAGRTAAVCLPHDWLTWKLMGSGDIGDLTTDRSDASGTGYFNSVGNLYRRDLVIAALGHDVVLPRVLGPAESPGHHGATLLGPGAGDNAAAALGVQADDDVIVSLGTSGTVFARSQVVPADPSGTVAGFADATGAFLPLVCTLNAARVLDVTARMLGVDLDGLSQLALKASPGAEGIRMVGYLEGERTPNRPDSTGALHGLTLANTTAQNVARAAVEGMLCGLADGLDAILEAGIAADRVRLIGGAAQSGAVREIAPTVFGVPVIVPAPAEYVADGAARQAAWVLSGDREPPRWPEQGNGALTFSAAVTSGLRQRYAEASARYLTK